MAICNNKPKTREEAYEICKPMIIRQANRFAKNRRDMYEDYFNDGVIGLLYAYDRYKDTAGMAFSSYAYICIMTHIKDKAIKDWKRYNQTSPKEIGDTIKGLQENSSAENDIVLKQIENKLNKEDRTIFRGRFEGKTFDELAKDLSASTEKSMTLHQVRNRWIKLSADLEKMMEA